MLASSDEAGVYAAIDKENRRIFIMGHSEYDAMTLDAEYRRDIAKGMDIAVPKNYYPGDDPTKAPMVSWRSCANLLFSNWLNYFVYQTTPYDITAISAE